MNKNYLKDSPRIEPRKDGFSKIKAEILHKQLQNRKRNKKKHESNGKTKPIFFDFQAYNYLKAVAILLISVGLLSLGYVNYNTKLVDDNSKQVLAVAKTIENLEKYKLNQELDEDLLAWYESLNEEIDDNYNSIW